MGARHCAESTGYRLHGPFEQASREASTAEGETVMIGHRTILAALMANIAIAGAAAAQSAPPSYQGDPDVYKVILENENFRVISATWKKGVTDKPHSHPAAFVVYPVTDCTIRLHNPDGSTRVSESKAGKPFAGPVIASHTAENISDHDCQAIFVERK
jgi:hypothetical protein